MDLSLIILFSAVVIILVLVAIVVFWAFSRARHDDDTRVPMLINYGFENLKLSETDLQIARAAYEDLKLKYRPDLPWQFFLDTVTYYTTHPGKFPTSEPAQHVMIAYWNFKEQNV